MSNAAEQRQAAADVATLAVRDLVSLWPALEGLPPEQVRDGLIDILPVLGEAYGAAAASLAADWYERERDAAQVHGTFRPILPGTPDRARWEALSRWGVDPLFAERPDRAAALERVSGGLGRTVLDQHRETVVGSALRDPRAAGWVRITRPGACGFCRMLADRVNDDGEPGVYTQRGAVFKSHDHCFCSAAPAWDRSRTVSPIAFKASQRKANWSKARKRRENERVYDYVRQHYS